MKGKDARGLSTEALGDLRARAVRAVIEERKSQTEVAQVLGIARASVNRWVQMYRRGGEEEVKPAQKGRPKGRALNAKQSAVIAQLVIGKRPDQLRLPFALWTREAVQQLIEDRYGLALSLPTVGRLLKDWGMTPQKPLTRAFEQDPKAVTHWLRYTYPGIRKRAKKEKGTIYFGDEMGLRSDHSAGTSYGLKGKTPIVPKTGKRFGCNMVSAIAGNGRMNWMLFKKTFTTPIFIEFMGRLVRQSKVKVFLIVDRHPVHKSAAVKKWLEDKADQIELFLLPGYSPELNPDEYLNHDVKANAVGRRRATDQNDFMANVRGYLWSTQRQPHVVQKFFHPPEVSYARETNV